MRFNYGLTNVLRFVLAIRSTIAGIVTIRKGERGGQIVQVRSASRDNPRSTGGRRSSGEWSLWGVVTDPRSTDTVVESGIEAELEDSMVRYHATFEPTDTASQIQSDLVEWSWYDSY